MISINNRAPLNFDPNHNPGSASVFSHEIQSNPKQPKLQVNLFVGSSSFLRRGCCMFSVYVIENVLSLL